MSQGKSNLHVKVGAYGMAWVTISGIVVQIESVALHNKTPPLPADKHH